MNPNPSAPIKGQPKDDFSSLSDVELASMFDEANNPPTETPALAEEGGEKKPDTSEEPTKEPETKEGEFIKEESKPDVKSDETEELKKSYEILKKKHQNLESLYGRQTNELGKLRAALKKKPTQEDFDENPAKAAEDLADHKEKLKEIAEVEKDLAQKEFIMKNIEFASRYCPDLEANSKDIFDLVTSVDKVSHDDASRLMSNIFTLNPWGVYQLNERAKLLKKFKALEAENALLKKAQKETVTKISGVADSVPAVRASTGKTSAAKLASDLSSEDIDSLSDEELMAQMENRLKQEK